MNSHLLAIDVRVVRRVSIALFGAALLAACDSDRVAAPKPAASASSKAPPGANSGVHLPNKGNMIIKAWAFDWNKPGLAFATYKIVGPGFVQATVVDNGPGDNDVFPGVVSLWDIPIGNYYICETAAPAGYALPDQPCWWTQVWSGSTSYGGNSHLPLVSATWDLRDGFGALIGPSTFTLTTSRSLLKITVVDNGQNDLDPALGKMTAKLPKAAVYELCETVPPADRYNANPACRTVDVSAGQAAKAGTFVNYEKQVYKP